MTTKKAILTTVALLSLLTCFASGGNNLQKQLNKKIIFPKFKATESTEGVVNCSFYFDDAGRIILTKLKGSNEVLKAYVMDKLYSIKYNGDPYKRFSYEFTFKREH